MLLNTLTGQISFKKKFVASQEVSPSFPNPKEHSFSFEKAKIDAQIRPQVIGNLI